MKILHISFYIFHHYLEMKVSSHCTQKKLAKKDDLCHLQTLHGQKKIDNLIFTDVHHSLNSRSMKTEYSQR